MFSATTVVAGQLAGAACGVPFRRVVPGALGGALLGLAFSAWAIAT
ncbi:MAG TPA: hypothetical protein VMF30_18520 [Pirellulales bacterium]|nr:hypothetical protein [Pirellulales bacterium]